MTGGADPRWALFRPLDLLAGALLLALAAACLPRLASPFGSRAEVSVDGRPYARLGLDGPRREMTVATPLGPLVLAYGGGNIRVTRAPCANRLCVRAGPISRAGATLTCLPCRVRVTVSGRAPEGVDAVTH